MPGEKTKISIKEREERGKRELIPIVFAGEDVDIEPTNNVKLVNPHKEKIMQVLFFLHGHNIIKHESYV